MFIQMRYCQNCNKNCSDKYFRKHCYTNNHLVFCVRGDWLNNAPREPCDSFKEILRNR